MKPEELSKLSSEEKRVRIAELCGWQPCRSPMQSKSDPRNDAWRNGNKMVRVLPDYLNDLNAMHEAEKTLNDEQADIYIKHLAQTTDKARAMNQRAAAYYLWHATAAQRADAFLLTLG